MRHWLLLVFTLFLLTSCGFTSSGSSSDRENEEYFRGTEGVYMEFVHGAPPPRLFYYGPDPVANEFELAVDLENRGASDAIGAIYVSGFSPDIIRLDGTSIEETGVNDCSFDLSGFDFGQGGSSIGFSFSCFGIGVSGNTGSNGDWNARLNLVSNYLFGIENIAFSSGGDDNWALHLGWDTFGGLDLLNHGRALVLTLSSIDFERYNGYLFSENAGVLKGDNYFFPGGEKGYLSIRGQIGADWPAGLDQIDQTFLVTSCYGYTTFATPKICIDPAPFDETKKVCTPRDYSWSGSQGAPVAISRLEQDSTPRKIFLTFTVENVGQGIVMNPGYLERCSPYYPDRFDSRHKDVVYIGDIRIGNQRLKCTPSHAVRLNNGRGTFTCEYDFVYATAKTAYETPVVVELWYGYQQTIQKTINIKRAI